MPVRTLNASDVRVLGQSKVTISTATTTNFTDVNLLAAAGYKHGDKVLVVFSATTAGTTDTVSFAVQDAPDSSGSIGTPAAAVTDGTLPGGTGARRAVTAVQLQPGRPWLRFRVSSTGATDTFVASVIVLAVGPMS
jgi:hypothetical protein